MCTNVTSMFLKWGVASLNFSLARYEEKRDRKERMAYIKKKTNPKSDLYLDHLGDFYIKTNPHLQY